MMVVRQHQQAVDDSGIIPTQGMTLVDCTKKNLDLYLPSAKTQGMTKQICWTSASRACGHKVVLHTYRGSCVLPKGSVTLIFHKDSWDSLHTPEPLVWYVNRQFGNKLQGQAVITPHIIPSDPNVRAMRNLLASRGMLPPRRNVGQGSSVAISADGNTLVVGGCNDDYWVGSVGAAWVYVRTPVASSCPELGRALQHGSLGLMTAAEAAAYNRLWHSMIVQTRPENSVLDGVQKSEVDKYLPVAGSPWMEAAKNVGDSVVHFNSSQGFSVAINGVGTIVMSGGPTQNMGQGGVWWFQRSDGDSWTQCNRWGFDKTEWGLDNTSHEFVGCSVSMQAFGEFAAASGRGVVTIFHQRVATAIFHHSDWTDHLLTVCANDTHLLVGCPDLDRIYVLQWPIVANSEVRSPTVLQVLQGPLDSAFGSSMSSTWQPNRIVVGAHRSNFLVGACHVFDYNRAERQYGLYGILQDGSRGVEPEVCQGSSVSISGQDGTTITVGSMLHDRETGSVDQWVWDFSVEDFVKQPNSLVPIGLQPGSMAGCSVACSGRGDVVVIGCPADSEFGSAAVFQ